MKRTAAMLALLWAVGAPGFAQEPPDWSVRAEVRMIAVPMAQALLLVPRLRSPATFPSAEQRFEALLANGEAELVNWVHVQSRSGQRACAESLEEVRYEVESYPPQIPVRPVQHTPFVLSILEPQPGRSGDFKGLPGVQILRDPSFIGFFAPFEIPAAYETRDAGATLEFEPEVRAASGKIAVSVVARLVRFEGMENTIAARPGPPTFRGYPMARFSEYNIVTDLELANGAGALIGSFTLPRREPRMLLFLFHAAAHPSLEIP